MSAALRLRERLREASRRRHAAARSRQERIVTRWLEDDTATLQSVADEFGVTRERVRQLVNGAGFSADRRTRRADALAKERAHAASRAAPNAIATWRRLSKPGITEFLREYARAHGLSYQALRRAVREELRDEWPRRGGTALGRRMVPRWTNDDLIAGLRALAEQLGHTPNAEELAQYQLAATYPTYQKRFGTYRRACELAGIEPLRRSRSGIRADRISDEVIMDALRTATSELGPEMSRRRYDDWRVHLTYPSSSTIMLRFETWGAALAAAQGLQAKRGHGRG